MPTPTVSTSAHGQTVRDPVVCDQTTAARKRSDAVDLVVKLLLSNTQSRRGPITQPAALDELKRIACKKFGLSRMIKNPEILARFPRGRLTPAIKSLLMKKPTRTLSGVTPIAVMTRPAGSCKYGCIYCPAATKLAAKSYTGFEPAALRARQYKFDPYLQASSRIAQFEGGGHPADKCEIIIMGGTFLEADPRYQQQFIKGVYDGLNCSGARRCRKACSLKAALRANEHSAHRAVGLTIETRPDVCIPHIDRMLSFGATRVELGVQHADDGIYRLINRGHDVQAVVDATRVLKDSAFKVLYHIMPGLPGSGKQTDVSFVKRLFADPRFRPDMLKIYPTLVMEQTGLHRMAQRGQFIPYSAEEAADIISEFYRHIPKYVRVMRIQRDIPAQRITAGIKKSNLRELVDAKIKEKGIIPQEIRWREVGLQQRTKTELNTKPTKPTKPKKLPWQSDFSLRKLEYDASGGKEFFLSFETADGTVEAAGDAGLIAGFIRLRFPKQSKRKEIVPPEESALVRELHVYGSEVPLCSGFGVAGSGTRNWKQGTPGIQHQGLGSHLLKAAEDLARDAGKKKMIIISGVGVREYYRKFGYRLEGPFMTKKL